MFTRLNRFARKKLAKGRRRKNTPKHNLSLRRELRHETLEDRRVLALLGVSPLDLPIVSYNAGGTTSYDSTNDRFSVDASPLSIQNQTTPFGLFFTGDVDINIQVDDTGALIGGTTSDDFVLTGDVDTDGDFIVDESGVLLTGEVVAFGFEDSGGTTDDYDFRFQVTGGALAGEFIGKDIGVTTSSENSTFTGDFTVDFAGDAKGAIGAIDLLPLLTPDLKLEKLVNGEQADDLVDAIPVNPGDTLYFTYLLENTGNTDILEADVEIVDDNGTPADLGDDVSVSSGDLILLAASDVGSDGILSPGEIWQYQYTTVAEDLATLGAPVVVNFETDGNGSPLSAGTIIDNEFANFGLNVTSQDQVNNPAMVFDSANPTGGDTDLATPDLGNLLIISEDADQSDPDDDAAGGTLTFTWDEAVTVDTVTLVDIDSNEAGGSVALFFDANGGLISSVSIPALGDNSIQTIDINVDNVARMDINLVSSGAVAELVFRQPEDGFYKNTAVATAQGATDMDMSHYVNGDPDPVDGPKITYNAGGTVAYDATSDIFSVDATPLTLSTPTVPFSLFFGGDLDINIVVDETGALVSGVAGDDFVLAGDADLDGDFIVDQSGILLTGEIIEFSSADSGGTTDDYEFRFMVTGGLLAPLYAGQDLLIATSSENSTFTGDFSVNFGGDAKGDICAVDPIVDQKASIGNYVFIDNDGNGLQNVGDQGINGITVNLLNDQNMVVASTVTDFDAAGNAGFYLFFNLNAGEYIVEFEVPDGVLFTTQDAGDDTRDSDADVITGQTDVITVADGEHRRDIDAGVQDTVTKESAVYSVTDYVSKHQNKKAGKIKGLDMHYSEHLDELSVTIDFKAYRGRLTDAFTIVITGGEWPAGTQDKYAIFYFDADIYGRHDGPVLTAYGYNGKYNAQSYRDSDGNLNTHDADLIATSKDDSVNWIKDLTVETYRKHGRWHRTMSFTIVASVVNDHVNLSGGDWEGAQFGNMTSFAIDTYDGVYTKYNGDGFLKHFCYCRHGWMDGDWVHTTCEIVETEVPIDDFFDAFGWVVSDYVEGTSDGDPPLDANDTESDLDWAGSVDAVLEGSLSD